jgi:hypothetical protein
VEEAVDPELVALVVRRAEVRRKVAEYEREREGLFVELHSALRSDESWEKEKNLEEQRCEAQERLERWKREVGELRERNRQSMILVCQSDDTAKIVASFQDRMRARAEIQQIEALERGLEVFISSCSEKFSELFDEEPPVETARSLQIRARIIEVRRLYGEAVREMASISREIDIWLSTHIFPAERDR